MRTAIINKTFSKLATSLTISFVLGKIIFKSRLFLVFSASFFGALYLLLGWILYLSLDGIAFFKNISTKILKKQFSPFDRFSYKNSGVYNVDNKDIVAISDLSDDEITKASMYSYIICGVFLLIASHVIFTP